MVADTLVEIKADTVDNNTHHPLSKAAMERQVEDMVVRVVRHLLDGIKCGHETQGCQIFEIKRGLRLAKIVS